MTRFLAMAAGVLLVAGALAYALDLVFLPPSQEHASNWAPHWRAYTVLWNFAEHVGRSGLREGVFPATIRAFDDKGLPAFLPWVVLGLGMAILTLVSIFLLAIFGKGRQLSQEPHTREPALGDAAAEFDTVSQDLEAAPLPTPPVSIRAAPSRAIPVASASVVARSLEQNLYGSEQALALAAQCVEDLRRAAVNLVLDPTVAQANQDLKDVHDALDELEMAFEQLRGQQHALMADLVQLNGQPNGQPAR
jgi:hypothetical protein